MSNGISQGNSWNEYQKLVLQELRDSKSRIDHLEEKVSDLDKKIAVLATKLGIYIVFITTVATTLLHIISHFVHISF